MRNIFFLFLVMLVLLTGCSKEVESVHKYEAVILNDAFNKSIPFPQAEYDSDLLKANKVKTITFLVKQIDSAGIDSATFVELDKDGKIIRRTTTDNTGEGCLPYMHRQEFRYDSVKRIKKILDYTFKYKANSVLENWMLQDTSQLYLFDWEDYSYDGDTIIAAIGPATYKFVKGQDGNYIKQIVHLKSNNQFAEFNYEYSGAAIVSRMETSSYDTPLINKYIAEENKVISKISRNDKEYMTIYEYDPGGLITTENHYVDGILESRIFVNYSYY